ncbi:MAG: hypothetical protein ACI4E1_10850 [Lachnospira sp.]
MLKHLRNNRLFVSFITISALILSFISASFLQYDTLFTRQDNLSGKSSYSTQAAATVDIERTEDLSSLLLAKTLIKQQVSSGRSSVAQCIFSILGSLWVLMLFLQRYSYYHQYSCDDNTSHSFVVKFIHDKDGQK